VNSNLHPSPAEIRYGTQRPFSAAPQRLSVPLRDIAKSEDAHKSFEPPQPTRRPLRPNEE